MATGTRDGGVGGGPRASVRETVQGMGRRANPAFAAGAVAVPLAAFAAAVAAGGLVAHTYVHVMAGVLWTGIDLFLAMVLGPVLGGLSVEARAEYFERFTPKMTFLMPTLATVTIFGGITLAARLGVFPNWEAWTALFGLVGFGGAALLMGWVFEAFRDRRFQAFLALVVLANGASLARELAANGMTMPGTDPLILAVLAVMVVLTVQGFGFLLPNEVRIYREMMSADPDKELIGRLGMRNAKLAGVQGLFQLSIVVLMVYLRWGG